VIRFPLADGLGTSRDEVASSIILFVSIAVGMAGLNRLPKKGQTKSARPGWIMIAIALAGIVIAFTVPQRYLRPRISKIRPTSTATLAIVSPKPGDTVMKPSFVLAIALSGGKIVPFATTKLSPNEGHLHVTIDGVLLSMTVGTTSTVDIRQFAPGRHTLAVEFVAADHAPFSPRVLVSESIVIAPPS
jgi:hypothetical protein